MATDTGMKPFLSRGRVRSISQTTAESDEEKEQHASHPPVTRRPSMMQGLTRRRSTLAEHIHAMRRRVSVLSMWRSSVSTMSKKKKDILLEPTYKTAPDYKVMPNEMEVIATRVLERTLGSHVYNSKTTGMLSCTVSNLIKEEIKDMNYPRHKIICHTLIGQSKDQGVQSASRCMWDTNTDTYACATYTNNSLFAVATIFAIYLE